MTGLQNLMAQMPGLADMQKPAYGGREMTAIRTINVKMGIRMELTSFTPGVPDATQLALPDGLTLMPMPALPTKPGGGGRQRGRAAWRRWLARGAAGATPPPVCLVR